MKPIALLFLLALTACGSKPRPPSKNWMQRWVWVNGVRQPLDADGCLRVDGGVVRCWATPVELPR